MNTKLNYIVFSAPEKPLVGDRPRPFGETMAFDPMSSTLIYGEREAVLVDPLTTIAEAEALAAWVKLYHRQLTTIYITHGHMDHFAGVSVLLEHFPNARAISTPETAAFAQKQVEGQASYRKMWPGQLHPALTVPEGYESDTFELEGEELRIIRQGHTDAPDSTSLYVPSLGLVVTGDVVYNQCHMYVGELTDEIRENWLAALDRIEALSPSVVVAGHKKPGTFDAPEVVGQTRQYLLDFARAQQDASSDEELFEAMSSKYPHWAGRQAWLMFGF